MGKSNVVYKDTISLNDIRELYPDDIGVQRMFRDTIKRCGLKAIKKIPNERNMYDIYGSFTGGSKLIGLFKTKELIANLLKVIDDRGVIYRNNKDNIEKLLNILTVKEN